MDHVNTQIKPMTNEEMIEEILMEASAYGLRLEVLETAQRLREEDPKMDRLDSYIYAFNEWVK
jgi:hypothetical protein